MADEEDENQPKTKKEKEKDFGPELAPGDIVNPTEYKMFDKTNMLKTLNIPGKQAYNFQKELSGTIQKRLEAIRLRLGTDNVDLVADTVRMELMAGLQSWENVDPATGQLIELRDAEAAKKAANEPKVVGISGATIVPPVIQISPSVMANMRAALPKPKQEDKSAMPAANRRMLATAPKFEGMLNAQVKAEFGDYYETIEKWDRAWQELVGKRPSELKPEEKLDVSGTDGKDIKKQHSSFVQQKKTSSFFKEKGLELGASAKASIRAALINAVPVIKKVKSIKKPPGTPAFLDGVIDYFLSNISPDCDLEAWLSPSNIVPVFRIREISPDVENCVVTIARVTHSKFIDDQMVASQIRSALETHHGYACKWHVIVGRKFGMQVDADKGEMLLHKITLYGRYYSTAHHTTSTIFALASGKGKSGVAVIRVSGSRTPDIIIEMTKVTQLPSARFASLRSIFDPKTNEKLDQGLVLWFPGPNSYTGEDLGEFHVHGGPAVVSAVLATLGKFENTRSAEPGEFTKRAFLNGKFDLTEAEAVADLVHAETSAQRRQALRQMEGFLSKKYSQWREQMLKALAHLEAYIDFGEEEAIELDTLDRVKEIVSSLEIEIRSHLNDHRRGERLRNGVHVTILGEPNVGKSTLLNHLCQRPAAIVSPIAGTTRDIVETAIDLGGYPVVLFDTAGLRFTEDFVEKEGVSRALNRAVQSDLIIVVFDITKFVHGYPDCLPSQQSLIEMQLGTYGVSLQPDQKVILLFNKIDLVSEDVVEKIEKQYLNGNVASCASANGVKNFLANLTTEVENLCGNPLGLDAGLTQQRHRHNLESCLKRIEAFWNELNADNVTMSAHQLQQAVRHVGKITGRIHASEILDVIFRDFCIGK